MRKRLLLLLLCLICLVSLCSCKAKQEFDPHYERAIGVILLNSRQELAEGDKVYAAFSDHQYLFHLDAAAVYYFDASAEIAYAGDENFAALTFAAHIDEHTVGAQGTVCYWKKDDSDNLLDVYYVYHDETGVYFNSGKAVDHVRMDDCEAHTVSLSEFPCAIEVRPAEPIRRFVVKHYDENNTVIASQSYAVEDVEDMERIAVESAAAYVTVEKYSDGDELIETVQLTKENNTMNISCESDGQVLGSKIIRLVWPEE